MPDIPQNFSSFGLLFEQGSGSSGQSGQRQARAAESRSALSGSVHARALSPFPSGDNRIWTPDETCFPFCIETYRVFDNSPLPYLRWTIPQANVGVINALTTYTDIQSLEKPDMALHIRRHKSYSFGINVGIVPHIFSHGSLTDVEELGDAGNRPGFAIPFTAMTRPIRLPLTAGNYEAVMVGSAPTLGTVFVSITGWCFRIEPYD